MEVIGSPIWRRTIRAQTKKRKEKEAPLKSLQTSVSVNYMLPESSMARKNNKFPWGPTNSYKCQRGFSNVLWKERLLLDGASQHSKSHCLQFNILICSKATRQSIFVAVYHNFLGPGMSANYKCSLFFLFYDTTEMLNFSARGWLFRLAFNVTKWVVGHTADKPQVEDGEGRSWGSVTFTLSLNSVKRQAPNLGNHCAISQTQIECDS